MTIREDVEDTNTENTGLSASDARAAFLKRWEEDAEEPSDNAEGAKPTEKKETASQEGDEQEELIEDDGDQSDTDQNDKSETIAGDDAKVVITVDGKEVTASVKDLKRLYGQEAALTRKSQEVAALRKQTDEQHARHKTALETLVKRAEDAYRPFADADMLVLSRELSPEDFKAVREEAKKAYENYKFLHEELNNFTKAEADKAHAEYQTRAAECLKALQDPEKGIKGFDEALYGELAKFAVAQGMPEEGFYRITDAGLLKMIHAAMRYDRAKKVTAQKTAQPAKKVIRARQPTDASGRFVSGNARQALDRLSESGTRDDAKNAFLSKWGVEKD